jgi:hypothetical protein
MFSLFDTPFERITNRQYTKDADKLTKFFVNEFPGKTQEAALAAFKQQESKQWVWKKTYYLSFPIRASEEEGYCKIQLNLVERIYRQLRLALGGSDILKEKSLGLQRINRNGLTIEPITSNHPLFTVKLIDTSDLNDGETELVNRINNYLLKRCIVPAHDSPDYLVVNLENPENPTILTLLSERNIELLPSERNPARFTLFFKDRYL